MPYTDAMRANVKETIKRSVFDDEELRRLADDPSMTVEQALTLARKVALSSASSDDDARKAGWIVKMIKGFSAD